MLFQGSPTGASETKTSSALAGAKVEELFISEHGEAELLAKQSPGLPALASAMRHMFSQENSSLSWVECQCKDFSSRTKWSRVQSSALKQPEAMSMMRRTTKLLVPQSLPLHPPWFSPPEAAQVSEKHARETKRNASAFFCLTFQFTPVNWEQST